MSGHRLCSPSNTYVIFPSHTTLNGGKGQPPQPCAVNNPVLIRRIDGLTASQTNPGAAVLPQYAVQKLYPVQNLMPPVIQNFNPQVSNAVNLTNPGSQERGTISVRKDLTNANVNGVDRKAEVNKSNRAETSGTQNRPQMPAGSPRRETRSAAARPVASNENARNPGVSTEKANDGNVPSTSRQRTPTKRAALASDSDSDLSFDEFIDASNKNKVKLPYTSKEDVEILDYVLTEDNIDRIGSLSLWRELEKRKENPKRTYQSLKNRFLRNIKPHLLTRFKIPEALLPKVKKKFPELKKASGSNRIPFDGTSNKTRPQPTTTQLPKPPPSPKPTMKDVETNTTTSQSETTTIEPERVQELVRRSVGSDAAEESAVELFNPGTESERISQSHIQSFHYSKVFDTFQDRMNLNLNLVILNTGSSELLANLTGPVKVDVVVSVTPVQENGLEPSNVRSLSLKEIPKRERKKKKVAKSRRKKCSRKYILKLKKGYKRKQQEVSPLRKGNLTELLEKIEKNKRKKEDNSRNCSSGMLLRSQRRKIAVDDSSLTSQSSTQETNCSVEDLSDYSQARREVSKMYQITIEPDDPKVPDGSDVEDDRHVSKKRPRRNDNPPRSNNMLLKNMVGMLSPSSKVFSGERMARKTISKNL